MENIIEIKNLNKSYSSYGKYVLENLNLSLEGNQVVGLLGPNGAGKTTLIKILVGLIREYQGHVSICGHSPDPFTKSIVSYLPDVTYFNENQKIINCIKFFKDMYVDFSEQRMIDLVQKLGLNVNDKIRVLSKGNKEKLQLALVLSRDAKVYILDEPIGGVDPAAREYILNFIFSYCCKDSLVIISTHLIEDIENHLNTFIFLNQGHIVRCGKSEEVKKQTGQSLNELFKEDFKCF